MEVQISTVGFPARCDEVWGVLWGAVLRNKTVRGRVGGPGTVSEPSATPPHLAGHGSLLTLDHLQGGFLMAPGHMLSVSGRTGRGEVGGQWGPGGGGLAFRSEEQDPGKPEVISPVSPGLWWHFPQRYVQLGNAKRRKDRLQDR